MPVWKKDNHKRNTNTIVKCNRPYPPAPEETKKCEQADVNEVNPIRIAPTSPEGPNRVASTGWNDLSKIKKTLTYILSAGDLIIAFVKRALDIQ